jgi:hypothetical protein
VVAINRNEWSRSIGTADRDHPVRAPAHGPDFVTILVTKSFARRSQSRWQRDDRGTGAAAARSTRSMAVSLSKSYHELITQITKHRGICI